MQKQWGQYHLTTELSKKHSHSTYLASPIDEPERQVALTVFASSLFSSLRESEKMLQKTQRIKQLKHAHMLPILNAGIAEEQLFVVREYLPNGSLRSHLKKVSPGGLKLEDALSIVMQVGETLLYAHQHNIVHGKLKPENILFDSNGQLVLTDFSLIERKEAIIRDQALEEYAFCYMAPEQFAGVCDSRSDQYALGYLTYELITGQVPFASQSLTSMMAHQRNTVPVPLSERVADLPPTLEVAVLKTLSQDSKERFFDFSLFLEVIQSVLSPPPAFPLLRSTSTGKNRTIPQAVHTAKKENISYAIHKRAAKHTTPERSNRPRVSSDGEDDIKESAGTHPLADTSLPTKSTESTSNPKSFLQSQLRTSSYSLDVASSSNKESAIPDHPLREHKHNESADVIEEIMPLSKASRSGLALITEEADEDVEFADFFEEETSLVGALTSDVHEESEAKTNKIISVVESDTDVLIPSARTRRSRKRLLRLVLSLSVIVAVIFSGIWFSGLISFSTIYYFIPSTINKSADNSRAVPTATLIPILKINLKGLPTAAGNPSQNTSIVNHRTNTENAIYAIPTTNNGYRSNTASAISNSIAANTNSKPSTTSTNSSPSTTSTNSSPSTTSTNSSPSTTSTNSSPSTTSTNSSPSATSTNSSSATATSTSTSTANSNPYSPYTGKLVLNDPLSDNSRGYGWDNYSPDSYSASCQFINGAYHAAVQANFIQSCYSALRESNFAFEVQMQVVTGVCGGLMVRSQANDGQTGYYLQICYDGSYQFDVYGTSSGNYQLASGSSAAITTGLGQSNLIAIVANGNRFDLYVNHKEIASAQDSTFSQGVFGVCAGYKTDAAYTNARVWAL